MKKRDIKRLAEKMQRTCYHRVQGTILGIDRAFVCVECPFKQQCFRLKGNTKLMFYTIAQVENMLKECYGKED